MVLAVEGNLYGYESNPHIFTVNNKDHLMFLNAPQMNHISTPEKTNPSCAAPHFPLDGAIEAF